MATKNNNAPAMDAATIAATAAAWLAKYASVRGIKDNGATLINEHGRDNFAAVLAACKATRAAEITTLHKDARGVLSFAAVLGREFDALRASAAWGRWCKLAAAEYADASAFVAACYPNVLSDGRPACHQNQLKEKVMEKTNLEMLLWGMQHIANNHGLECDLDYEEEGEVCIYGGCNIPTLADVKMLCEDVGIEPEYIEACDCGIDVWLPLLWWNGKANEPYRGGAENWKRREACCS